MHVVHHLIMFQTDACTFVFTRSDEACPLNRVVLQLGCQHLSHWLDVLVECLVHLKYRKIQLLYIVHLVGLLLSVIVQ